MNENTLLSGPITYSPHRPGYDASGDSANNDYNQVFQATYSNKAPTHSKQTYKTSPAPNQGATLIPTSRYITLVFDATIEEQHTITATVTNFPVETGYSISDNIRLEPRILTITGYISNHPIWFSDLSAHTLMQPNYFNASSASSSIQDRVQMTFNLLEDLTTNFIPISITTTLPRKNRYQNMYITNVTCPREANSSDYLKFTITAQKLITAQAASVTIPSSPPETQDANPYTSAIALPSYLGN